MGSISPLVGSMSPAGPEADVFSELNKELKSIHSLVGGLEAKEILLDPSGRLEGIFKRLDRLAALEAEEVLADSFLKTPKFAPVLDSISRFRFLYNLKLETEQAEKLLASPAPWETIINFTFYENYLQLAKTEYEGSGLKPGDCVLFLGSGPLPLSLIVLCREYALSGIGIEQDEARAALSRKVIECLGLSDSIEIISGNHFSLPFKKPTDLVMVAAQAEPKEEIFGHLAKVLPKDCRVSFRIYEKGLRKVLDNSFPPKILAGFEEYLRVSPEPPVNNTVVFLKRN
ncbi:nicotianamine synthase family protein [Methanosarcina sp. Mfa9]|uniref:nicotianamine synthase family protein n=1 Tax=Methanosarcina sp. Mfa9 TaxID=3439063 RepID=UPI003F836E15